VDRALFFDHLRKSRLFSEEQMARLNERFPKDDTAHRIAEALLRAGLLTSYQAKQVSAGRTKELVLGQYRVLDELGRGGFGRVYKAVHTVMDRTVAIKVLSPELLENERVRGWFRREVLTTTKLYHPNIVMALDANEVDDLLFLVMEFVDGCDLDSLVRRRGPLPLGLARDVMRQATEALHYAHGQGMVHRDIKPANLLIPKDAVVRAFTGVPGTPPATAPVAVKVVDFGLARLRQSGQAQTLISRTEAGFLGTPDYVAPEQARNAHAADGRSDLYSLGCTFYFALSGRRPFVGASVMETLVKHLEEEAAPLEEVRPEIPAGIAAAVRRLMVKDPAQRFQTAAELLAELAAWPEDGDRRVSALVSFGQGQPACADDLTPSATRLIPDLAFQACQPSPLALAEPAPLARKPATCTDTEDLPSGAAGTPLPEPPPAPRPGPLPAPSATALLAPEELSRAAPVTAGDARPGSEQAERPDAPEVAGADLADAQRVDPSLRRSWRAWMSVVEVFVRGGSRSRVREPDYRRLHAELRAACRAHAERASGPVRDFFRRLEAIVEPWVTPQALASTDRETLDALLTRCRRADELLGGGGWAARLFRAVAVLAVVTVAGVLGWAFTNPPGWAAPLRSLFRAAWASAERNPLLWSAVALPVVVLVTVWLFSRALRA
jgi:eukaryotic-like serine/threonine-protein kinase